jgi:hypothetical protein
LRELLKYFYRPQRPHVRNVGDFLSELITIAPPAGWGCYAFKKTAGGCHGFVQFIIHSDRTVEIHRLWTLEPNQGNGKVMLGLLCDLADKHGVEIKLTALPFGRKPYARSRAELKAWYQSAGFQGEGWKLSRPPKGLWP